MKNKKDLEYFKALKYNVGIRKKHEKIILFIPELGVIATDDNLDNVYKNLELQKENYFKAMVEAGLEDSIIEPKEHNVSGVYAKSSDGIGSFIMKVSIVSIIIFIGIQFVVGNIADNIENRVEQKIKSISSNNIILKTSELADKIINLPDKKVETAKNKLKTIIIKFKPLIDEARALLNESEEEAIENDN